MPAIEKSYKYLKFSSLIETKFWDYYTLSQKDAIFSNYHLVKLTEVIKLRKAFINIDDDVIYKRCRVQIQGKGVVLRDEVLGKEIKTKKQQVCKEDDFLVAEIDAKVGGYGIVPQELEGAIVSGHYFLFDIDKTKLIPEFLGLVVKQYNFSKQVKSTGSTNYAAIRPYHVLEYKIPLPEIIEQKKLIDAYKSKIEEARVFGKEAIKLQFNFEKNLFEKLGVQLTKSESRNQLLQFIDFTATMRWDTLFLLGKLTFLKASYPMIYLKEIISDFNKDLSGKSLRIDSSKNPEQEYHYIGMEHVEKETGRLIEMPKVFGNEIKSQTLRVPEGFFIYGKLRPYLNKYWLNESVASDIICSSEFFVFNIDDNINKQFFKYVISSQIIQTQISDKTSGARMPRINEDIFMNLKIPLPKREIQDEIVIIFDKIVNQIITLKEKASIIKIEAEKEFDNQIYK